MAGFDNNDPNTWDTTVGGLGGLGGFDIGNVLGAIGMSLLSSPHNNPFQNLPQAMQLREKSADKQAERQAMAIALRQAGIDPRMAGILAANPAAAALMVGQQNQQKQQAVGADIAKMVGNIYSGAEPGAAAKAPAGPQPAPQPAPGGATLPWMLSPSLSESLPPQASGMGAGMNAAAAPIAMPPAPGLPDGYTQNLTQRESGGDPNAQAPTSSAFGPVQFTKGTWNTTVAEHPELGLTPADFNDPSKHMPAFQAFTMDNAKALAERGHDPNNPANLYASHFLGRSGGPRFLNGVRSNPDAPAASYVDQAQVEANRPVFFNRDGTPKTAGDVYGSFQQTFAQPQGPSAGPMQATAIPSSGVLGLPAPVQSVENGAPFQVAANSSKIPVPLPANLPPLKSFDTGTNASTMRARAVQRQSLGLQIMARAAAMGEGGKGYSEMGKAVFDEAKEYLKPSDTMRILGEAGIDPKSPQGRQLLTAAADKRPTSVQEFSAQATTPGYKAPGTLAQEKAEQDRYMADRQQRETEANNRRTTDSRSYDIYRAQELEAGREPKTFEAWVQMPKGSATQINNIPQKVEATEEVERAKGVTKFLNEHAERAPKLAQRSADLDLLSRVISKTNTARGATLRAYLDGAAAEIGLSKGTLSSQKDLIDAITNRIGPSLREPGSGAQSDSELRGFLSSLPRLAEEISVEVDGRTYTGRFVVSGRGSGSVVTVTTPSGGITSTQVGNSPANVISRMLLRELVRGEIAREAKERSRPGE